MTGIDKKTSTSIRNAFLVLACLATIIFVSFTMGRSAGWHQGWQEAEELWKPKLDQCYEAN